MADSRADRAGRLARHALNRFSANDSQQVDAILSQEVQNQVRKQRASYNEAATLFGTTEPGYTTNVIDSRYDTRQYYGDGADIIEPDLNDLHAPVDFSGKDVQAPTTTGKIDRPRTFAAAFDENRSILTIVFSTGVIYNYYDVDRDEWEGFKGTISKWEYIRDVLDPKPRGYASTSDVPPLLQAYAARAYRTSQIAKYLNKGK
jgi:hypothetical protein